MVISLVRGLVLSGLVAGLAACNNGGDVVYTRNAKSRVVKGSPFAHLNEGGKALVVETGKTATTGVHGWVSVQSVAAQRATSSTEGTTMVINKAAAYR